MACLIEHVEHSHKVYIGGPPKLNMYIRLDYTCIFRNIFRPIDFRRVHKTNVLIFMVMRLNRVNFTKRIHWYFEQGKKRFKNMADNTVIQRTGPVTFSFRIEIGVVNAAAIMSRTRHAFNRFQVFRE